MEAVLQAPVEGYIPAIGRVTLFREGQGKQATFRAIVLDWDKENPDWSMKTSNGVRYHRKTTLEVFNRALQENGSLPIMYNHITEGAEADQLGVIERVIDTTDGMIIEGNLNLTKKRVSDEIVPGFLKNVSLQVIAEDYYEDEKTETIFAKPSRALEVSFVPVNGREGAKLLDLAIKESLSGKTPQQTYNTNMEMARKAVAFEEIEKSFMETDLGIAFKLIEGKLSGIDKEIKKLQDKGMLDKDIVKTISRKFGVEEDELEDLLGEDITTGNSGAATATKLHGVDKEKEENVDKTKADKYQSEIEILLRKHSKNHKTNGPYAVMSDVADKVSKEISKKHSDISQFDVYDWIVSKYGVTRIESFKEGKQYAKYNGHDVYIMQHAKATHPGYIVVQYLDGGYTMEVKKNELTNITSKYPKKEEALIDEIKDKQYELYSKIEAMVDGMTDEELKESLKESSNLQSIIKRYPTRIDSDILIQAAKRAGISEEYFLKFWWAAFKNETSKTKVMNWAKMIANEPIDQITDNRNIIKAFNWSGFGLGN